MEESEVRRSGRTAGDARPRTRPATGSEPYYAEGLIVRKRSIETDNGDGTSNITVGFPVCIASEWIGEEGAHAVARMLCIADGAPLRQDETDASPREAKRSEGMD